MKVKTYKDEVGQQNQGHTDDMNANVDRIMVVRTILSIVSLHALLVSPRGHNVRISTVSLDQKKGP